MNPHGGGPQPQRLVPGGGYGCDLSSRHMGGGWRVHGHRQRHVNLPRDAGSLRPTHPLERQLSSLHNSGEAIRVVCPDGTLADLVMYSDTDGWTQEAYGAGASLEWEGFGWDNFSQNRGSAPMPLEVLQGLKTAVGPIDGDSDVLTRSVDAHGQVLAMQAFDGGTFWARTSKVRSRNLNLNAYDVHDEGNMVLKWGTPSRTRNPPNPSTTLIQVPAMDDMQALVGFSVVIVQVQTGRCASTFPPPCPPCPIAQPKCCAHGDKLLFVHRHGFVEIEIGFELFFRKIVGEEIKSLKHVCLLDEARAKNPIPRPHLVDGALRFRERAAGCKSLSRNPSC